MISVLLADDHEIVMDGLRSILLEEEGIEVVACVQNGQEAVDYILKNQVDIAVLDISMPIMNGIEATRLIKERSNTKILILSMHDQYEYIDELLEAGCKGYILKNKGREELVEAIKRIYNGGCYIGDQIQQRILDERLSGATKRLEETINLTTRELEILKLIALEFNTPEIANKLSIKESTVNTHRRNLIQKLGVRSSMGLVSYAFRNKLVE